ncbi:MAG: PorT family protein [Bacteroidetes bacterium]|nr:PorT family protein [Bacteroidota bacterium]
MKRKLSLLIVITVITYTAQAQFYLGAKLGLNFANFSASVPNYNYSTKIGLNGGAALKYKFNKNWGVQMDLLYSQMGSIGKSVTASDDGAGNVTTITTKPTYTFSYLQVPVYANLEIPIKSEELIPYRYRDNIVSIHLFAGGYFGYGLSNNTSTLTTTSVKDENNNVTTTSSKVSGSNSKFNAIDYGLGFGAGVSFKLSTLGKLTIDGRYLLGMGNFNSNKAYTATSIVMKNTAPQIQLGYIHRISKLKRWQTE